MKVEDLGFGEDILDGTLGRGRPIDLEDLRGYCANCYDSAEETGQAGLRVTVYGRHYALEIDEMLKLKEPLNEEVSDEELDGQLERIAKYRFLVWTAFLQARAVREVEERKWKGLKSQCSKIATEEILKEKAKALEEYSRLKGAIDKLTVGEVEDYINSPAFSRKTVWEAACVSLRAKKDEEGVLKDLHDNLIDRATHLMSIAKRRVLHWEELKRSRSRV